MDLLFNGKAPQSVNYNGSEVLVINWNGTKIWEKQSGDGWEEYHLSQEGWKVDLNNQWELATVRQDADTNFQTYQSFSNYHVQSSKADMKVTIAQGISEFTLHYGSYAESNYDYTLVGHLDIDMSNVRTGVTATSTTVSTSYWKASSMGAQSSSAPNRTVTYTIADPSREHFIWIRYRKDTSSDNYDDRGYVSFDKRLVFKIDGWRKKDFTYIAQETAPYVYSFVLGEQYIYSEDKETIIKRDPITATTTVLQTQLVNGSDDDLFAYDGYLYSKKYYSVLVNNNWVETEYYTFGERIRVAEDVVINTFKDGTQQVDWYEDKVITANAYSGNTNILSSEIKPYITEIGENAYRTCSAMTSVTIPSTVTTLGNGAFRECSGLTSVTLPDSVTTVEDNIFYNDRKLKSVTLSNNITTIPQSMFGYCSALSSITIPDSVTSIGGYAFRECRSLTSVIIPESVETIDQYAFSGCTSLTSVTLNEGLQTIGENVFASCNKVKQIIIPSKITNIPKRTFYECSGLTSIVIPSNVESIGEEAFRECRSLSSLTLNEGLKSINNSAFYGCSGLTSVVIPNSVTNIGSEAFRECRSLTSVTIPNSLTRISGYLFGYCIKLKLITYNGTIEQWNALPKGDNWKNYVPSTCVVQCTDGDTSI